MNVFLTWKEARELPHTVEDVSMPGGRSVSKAVVLGKNPITGACVFFQNGGCAIYRKRPLACRLYSCLEDSRPTVQDFVRKRFDVNGALRVTT